jgi:hypothetical protein
MGVDMFGHSVAEPFKLELWSKYCWAGKINFKFFGYLDFFSLLDLQTF